MNVSGNTTLNNVNTINNSLNVSGITTLNNKTIVKGILNVNNGSSFAVPNNFMQSGSLTIGDTTLNYGGNDLWTTNTSGLLLECSSNT